MATGTAMTSARNDVNTVPKARAPIPNCGCGYLVQPVGGCLGAVRIPQLVREEVGQILVQGRHGLHDQEDRDRRQQGQHQVARENDHDPEDAVLDLTVAPAFAGGK